jgi:ABC-type glycerol-3-phosphate transport system substrate-binding protein
MSRRFSPLSTSAAAALRRRFALPAFFFLAALLVCLAAAPAARSAPKTKLVVWGLASGKETAGLDAAVAEFMRQNPTSR